MIIEGRTIKTVEEMLEFCKATVAATHADPSAIRLHIRKTCASPSTNLRMVARSTTC